MSDLRAMQRLCGLMRKAVQDYEMIAPGDRVMVGVSGGKDSVALTIGLSMLRKYIGFDYEVVAVTLDPQFDHQPMDYSALAELFRQHGIPYEVRRTEIGPVVFEYRKEKNPCALCAKLRRGALHTAAQELGCNKVALGHHLDDAVETFYMNLWREGRIGCFSPVTYLSQRDLTLIRPMLLATEYERGKPIQRQLQLVSAAEVLRLVFWMLTKYAGMSGLAFWTNIMFVLLTCARGWAGLTLYKTQEETL